MSRTFEEHAELYDLAFSWDTEQDADEVLLWDWAEWNALIGRSPFRQTAAYDGRKVWEHRAIEVGPGLEGTRLVWHELHRA